MNITDRIYEKKLAENDAPGSFPLIKEAAKCIKCMRCINVCDKIQSVNAWELRGTGARAAIGAAGGKTISESGCTLCGQCITHCPVAALKERSDEERVIAALGDPDLITVIQIAPAVRAAWAESMKLTAEKANVGRLVSLTRALGFNYVFDTDFSADLTVMEETSELIERLKSGKKYKYPLFTSCCPAWVTFAKERFPDAAENLSSTKSPQQMFGAAVKGYFAGLIGENPSKIFSVSVMPCLAKKKEAADSPNAFENGRDVDAVITTRELARMITSANHDVEAAEEENFDSPLGLASGAGVIFGTTGGVSEAVLRTAYYFITGKNPSPDCFSNVRENDNGMRKYTIDIAGAKVSLGIASGLRNARRLIEMIESGEEHFDIVEIMACPGGCSGGGGQPIHDGFELAAQRAEILKTLDCSSEIRFAHENPSIKRIYDEYYGAPLSEKAHAELHTK
ncbi:NADP-reducing hydrogenase subunit HndD [bioreactor metagenome]|uniref:NADP-reducing hydrogenase subunit HndD n=1 Tax=bioreactor metagenome TaxID=1076179 RepID=A0A645CFA6_9ZZZZ